MKQLCRLGLFVLTMSAAQAWGQVTLPDTPAGRVLAGWLEAFNSGDPDRLRSYYETYVPTMPADPVIPFMARSGGLDVVEVPSSDSLSIEFVLKERASETRGMGRLVVEEQAPHVATSFPFTAIPPGATPVGFTIDADVRSAVIEGAIAALRESYVFPALAEEMAGALRRREREGEYDEVTDGAELSALLTEHLREVSHDLHLGVNFRPAALPPRPQGPNPDAAARNRQMEQRNCGFERVEHLANNVGYLKFNVFADPGICRETAVAAMAFLQNVDALIFDMRDNGGGSPDMVAFVSSYLFAEPTHLNDLWTRATDTTREFWTLEEVPGKRLDGQPVYVLTSARTFSGAEEFTYNLKSRGRATIVGERTRGGAHLVRGQPIDDRFAIAVPFARAINPITGTNWEGTGVEPDVQVPATDALAKAQELVAEELRRR